ncbi:2-oxoglutarate dehydrogenase E1 component [Roseospira marina]|uniref:2-oxoglutarate dehydrogenase E1 component n=1 Tax=Roseospira marina TaxID=140057 RepID=A0A5M6IE27_9PROT|nr:2-oxoglutarate dehydrogenase E1 component [Roseospira marina]KAA5606541.1 2-oxoglutarate dehydrogenase E1 component [Roseospira marina]MBB4314030.1 2-oxoglutarate dehydrogenase E1 component [Roseospira marina]MBB5087191.1 2-oxoglutarate dehydrogenase E1 component [Roseospira marina]
MDTLFDSGLPSSFLSGANATYIAELYERYLADPDSVDTAWRSFFAELSDGADDIRAELRGPSWNRQDRAVIGTLDPDAEPAKEALKGGAKGKGKGTAAPAEAAPSTEAMRAHTLDSIRALMMIRAYRVRGHLEAQLDPLGLNEPEPHPELDYRSYGFTDADLDREIFIDNVLGLESATLRRIVEVVRETYCGHIGVEFMHIQYPDQKAWIQRRVESELNRTAFTDLGRKTIMQRIIEAETFETYLHRKYIGTKRFGLEGAESTIPAIEQILKRGSQLGLEHVVIGMAHRGRLNILTNVMHKPLEAIFSEFEGNAANPEDVQGSGDVKYHLGTSADRDFDGKTIHVSLNANPSHLEAVDPVVLGKVRARQTQIGPEGRSQAMGLLLHGDAAMAGQGVVAECFALSQLIGYRTGGTIHIVVNNQIGFTTNPKYARSGQYCTDIAKMIQAPILHVNGDNPEAVVHAARVAIEFRQEFHCDVVLDIVCYRRHGHNESDEPAFTQPRMYKRIGEHPTTREIYARHVIDSGLLTQEDVDGMLKDYTDRLDAAFKVGETYRPNRADWLTGSWEGLEAAFGEEEYKQYVTAAKRPALETVFKAISSPPENFDLNPKIARQLKAKAKMGKTGEGIDWATAEALAFGTLVLEGHPVRLSGQDVGRGTFSQRHAVLVDQTDETKYFPLNSIREGQAEFNVFDSPLSEYAVLGFEYGYSAQDPMALVLWEAQFGDFANGAQVIFDQFIAAAEYKWLRMSGLVVLLPHGYEGQGPEHSSARLERYLQLCAEDNMQVCNLTTPANYFHALRRQIRRNFRKPLIIMSPKSLLRHKLCVSPLDALSEGGRFYRVLPETDDLVPDEDIRRVVLCTGKVYYDLLQARRDQEIKDVALVRVEQLYPWPKDSVQRQLSRYPKAEVVWCQEEPANMGAWVFVDRRLQYALEELRNTARRAHYAGRKASASTAAGVARNHTREQAQLIEQALTWSLDALPQPFVRPTGLSQVN